MHFASTLLGCMLTTKKKDAYVSGYDFSSNSNLYSWWYIIHTHELFFPSQHEFLTIAVECGDPPNFNDGTKCGGVKLPPGKKRCNWNDGHDFWGGIPQYNTNITYECPEG